MKPSTQFLRTFYSAPVIAVGLGALLYGLYQRWFVEIAYADGPAGFWNIVVDLLASPQFLVSVLLPIWLIYTVLSSRRGTEETRLVRLGSNRALLWSSYKSAGRGISVALIVVLLVWALASIGLPLRSMPTADSATMIFREARIVPLMAFVFQAALLTVALFCIQSVMVVLRRLPGKGFLPVIFALGVWSWTLSCLFGLITPDSLLHASHFFDAAAFVANPGYGAIALTISLLAIAACWVCMVLLDWRATGRGSGFHRGSLIFGASTALLLLVAIASAAPRESTFTAVMATVFAGTAGSITQALLWNFLFLGMAFILQIRLADMRHGFLGIQLIRVGSVERWLWLRAWRQILASLTFVIAVGLYSLAVFVLFGGSLAAAPTDELVRGSYHFFINGFLQLVLYSMIVLVAAVVFSSRTIGVLILAGVFLLSLVLSNPTGWSPFGASGMTRVQVGWDGVFTATIALIVASAIVAATSLLALRIHKPSI